MGILNNTDETENVFPEQKQEAQLQQGPIEQSVPPVTESESNIADLTRFQKEHPELQQLAMMSSSTKPTSNYPVGTAEEARLAYNARTTAAQNAGKSLGQESQPILSKTDQAIKRFNDGKNKFAQPLKYADGGDVAPDTIPADQFPTESQQPINQNQSIPDTIPADQFVSDTDKYGGLGQQAKTFGEHAASAATFGLSTKAETALGVKPEDIAGRTAENPVTGLAGSITGLLVPGAPEAKILGKTGELAAGAVRGSSVLSKIGASAVKGAVENAMFQVGDETSKSFVDPNPSVQTALTNIGLSSVLGGALGAGFGTVPALWEGSKASKFVDEFKSRVNEHLADPNLPNAPFDNLNKFYQDTKSGFKSLFSGEVTPEGERLEGIKNQAIDKLVPKTMENTGAHIEDVSQHFEDTLNKMKQANLDNPGDPVYKSNAIKILKDEFQKWQESVTSPGANNSSIFKATENLKRGLDDQAGWDSQLSKSDTAYPGVAKIRDSANFLRTSLEDQHIWGDAGKLQQDLNGALNKFRGPAKDFDQSFTAVQHPESGGKVNVLDQDKLESFFRTGRVQKGERLDNYLDAADRFRDQINKAYESAGIERPFQDKSADAVKTFTDRLAPGAKAADTFVKGLINKSSGESAGAIGGFLAGWPGYMLGKHVAGPIIDSVVPNLLKPILGSAADGTALKSAMEFVSAFSKGESDLNKGIKNLFTASKETLPSGLLATDKEKNKLDEQLKALAQNPSDMTKIGGKVSHYLPDHGTALAQTAMSAVNYLNSQRPQSPKVSPLDTPSKPDPMAVAKYSRILGVAQQPLSVLENIKTGTLQPSDVKTIATLYPDLYNKIQQKIVTEISNHTDKSEPIPYVTKMGMSLFMGKAMDSTMLPESIQAAQLVPQNLQQTPQGKQLKSPRKPTAASAKSMETVANSYRTPNSARAETKSQLSD